MRFQRHSLSSRIQRHYRDHVFHLNDTTNVIYCAVKNAIHKHIIQYKHDKEYDKSYHKKA